MIDTTNLNDRQLVEVMAEIIKTLNKHERQIDALQQSIEMGGKTTQLFINAYKESEDKRL